MPVPMTLAEAKTVDLDVGEDAVATAEAEAQEAADLVAALERAAIEGKDKPKNAAAATEAKQLHEFAVKRAARTRDLADQARAARRLLDLEQVGKQVEQIAAAASAPDAGMAAALRQIADGWTKLQQLGGDHDAKVGDAITAARQLGVEPAAPNGPRASSAHVAIVGGSRLEGPAGIQSGNAIVGKIGDKVLAEAAQLAAKGDADSALKRLQAARYAQPPERQPHYFLGANGLVHGVDNPDMFRDQLRKGEMRELDDAEVDAYLDGRFHGRQPQA